jgi:hypothetical protein
MRQSALLASSRGYNHAGNRECYGADFLYARPRLSTLRVAPASRRTFIIIPSCFFFSQR